jgi:hypothetical protein
MKHLPLFGFPLGAMSFLIAAGATNQLAGGIWPVIIGTIAAAASLIWLKRLDRHERDRLQRERIGAYKAPYPHCWGCVKDALHSTHVLVGRSVSAWQIFHEDEHRGFIQAQIQFEEQIVTGNNPLSVPVVIFVVIRLEPDGGQTRVSREYDIRKGRIDTAARAINTLESTLEQTLNSATLPPVNYGPGA